MHHLRSERIAAALLLAAAAAGLLLANLPFGRTLIALRDTKIGAPGLSLTLGHWVSDGLLALFFFLVAVELKREAQIGELRSLRLAMQPAIAAIGGVLVPALVYLGFTAGTRQGDGWPIPTATDIAFAIGVLAAVGRHIPVRVRIFLLALAVIDDLIAIAFIAVLFTESVDAPALGFAAVGMAAFWAAGRVLHPRSGWVRARRPQWPIVVALVVLATVVWVLVYRSGIHPTLAGVALGIALPRHTGAHSAHVLEPWSNTVVLPLFAFSSALVAVPALSIEQLTPAFWGIVIGLPVGKFVGIGLVGLALWGATRRRGHPLPPADIAAVAALGGIGFTVSLLMNSLAFRGQPAQTDEGTLAVLVGSAIAIAMSGVVVWLRSRAHERARLAAGRRPRAAEAASG